MKELNRLGPQEKCPACGWRLDADAYRCPKCMIYFCFKCRRRVTVTDPQYQCLNQQCQYYGKLLCVVCTESVPEYQTYQQPQVHPGCSRGVGIVVVAVIFGIAVWWLFSSFLAGLITLATTLVAGCIIAATMGWRIVDETTYVATQVQTGDHKACIACKQPVEVLRT